MKLGIETNLMTFWVSAVSVWLVIYDATTGILLAKHYYLTPSASGFIRQLPTITISQMVCQSVIELLSTVVDSDHVPLVNTTIGSSRTNYSKVTSRYREKQVNTKPESLCQTMKYSSTKLSTNNNGVSRIHGCSGRGWPVISSPGMRRSGIGPQKWTRCAGLESCWNSNYFWHNKKGLLDDKKKFNITRSKTVDKK